MLNHLYVLYGGEELTTNIKYMSFAEIDLKDCFFDSLKNDYPDFSTWYVGKQEKNEMAYVNYKDGILEGFLYFKDDGDSVKDVEPILKGDKILKIGTFKINPHKTRLGERFIKVVLDHAIMKGYEMCYVTIFDKHDKLIELFQKYGFKREGIKTTNAGTEGVYVKRFDKIMNDICEDYPLVKVSDVRKYLLAIYPKYHTVMFPDSKLRTEQNLLIKDISHTNSIHKIYVCNMDVEVMQKGDIVVLYRTASGYAAEYSSVVTSICVVEEIRNQNEFADFEEFYKYASKYSVFDKNDLHYWYRKGGCKTIKMLYNIALPKRIVRHNLIEVVGLERNEYWGFFEMSDNHFNRILELSGVNKEYIIN